MGKRAIFISCGIFQKELEYLVREKGLDWEITFLKPALHVNFDKLKEALISALEEHRRGDAELKVLYGRCHPEVMEIVERYGAKKLRAANCLEAILGAEQMARLNREGKAFFLSAGWVENWQEMFELGARDFNFDFKSLLKGYTRAVVIDAGVIPLDEEKIRAFSSFTGLPVERVSVSLRRFYRLIEEL